MTRAPIEGQVTGVLTHHVNLGYDKQEITYRRQCVQAVRPPSGHPPTEGVVRCDICGRRVRYRVFSVEAAERQHRHALAAAWIGLAVAAASVAGLVWNGTDAAGASPMVVLIGIVGIIAGVGFALAALSRRENGFGLRLGPQLGLRYHAITHYQLRIGEMVLTCPLCAHAQLIDRRKYGEVEGRLVHRCLAL
jgi:hypothetical protein